MGVHGAYVVSALLFYIIPSKSSKIIRIIYLKILVLKKIFFLYKMGVLPPWSQQNGRACPHGLYFHVHLLFFFAQSSGSTDGDDVHLCSMICKCVYTLRFPAFGLKSLQDGCALCMCCFALLFNIVPVISLNIDEDYLSI